MKDTIKATPIDMGIDITKMHGHMDIILTDVKTGKVETIHEENMMTNALQEYFRNMGFLNFPNNNQNNLVEELLGGIMAFDDEISESASIVHVPAGLRMIANGSVGTLNNGNPTELGSYSSTESGWQQDGSYVQTYDYSTSQGNGTIACVCLAGKDYAYVGEGNSKSKVAHSTKRSLVELGGTNGGYTFPSGRLFGFDYTNSTCCHFSIQTRTEQNVTTKYGLLRKYRIPMTKMSINGTKTALVLISEQEITLDSDLTSNDILINYQPFNDNLLIWNEPSFNTNNYLWGTNFTQYLWTLTPSGNLSKETVLNTTGDSDLQGLTIAYFDGDYAVFPRSHRENGQRIDTRTFYVWDRTNGTMNSISNEFGNDHNVSNVSYNYDNLLRPHHGSGDGRIYNHTATASQQPCHYIIDCVNLETYATNGILEPGRNQRYNIFPLILIDTENIFYRDQSYIASINNLATPVVKTSEKTMKIVYRITFDEEEGTSTS